MSNPAHVWYRNPWVWLIIALPMSAVIAGIATVIITSQNQPDMVVDDYYKKGKAINMELSLYERAKELQLAFQLSVSSDVIKIKSNQTFPALKVSLIHSTLKARDFNLVATPNAQGELTSTFEQNITGKWQIVVSPMDESWRVRTELALPTSDWVEVN